MTDLSRERLAELRRIAEKTVEFDPGRGLLVDRRCLLALLDMAEQLLALKSALGADAQTTTGFGGAMERRPDWTQFDPALHADKDRTEHVRPLWTDDEDRLIDKAAAKALREIHETLLAPDVDVALRQRADELQDGR